MTIELNDLPTRLMELRHRLRAGEEVTLTDGGEAVAKVVPQPPPERPAAPQRLGFAKGSFLWMAPDFDDPLPDEFWFGDDA
jgi:antitoxin (DNA-binding transcriptional repressor) of toxin-antitoxin stability system